MHEIKVIGDAGRLGNFFLLLFCLLLLLDGCAAFRQKRVIPPPPPPTVVSPPIETPGPSGTTPPTVTVPGGRRPGVTVTEPPVVAVPPAVPPPEEFRPVTGRAGGIYRDAEEALQGGRYSSAEMLLERALRIEPRNGYYWYTLGMAKFKQGQYSQAVQFCLKAESLAASQPALLARSRDLLARAKEAAGTR